MTGDGIVNRIFMTKKFHFDGIIRNVRYAPQITDDLTTYEFSDFDINRRW